VPFKTRSQINPNLRQIIGFSLDNPSFR
jgi:hypothetical protein